MTSMFDTLAAFFEIDAWPFTKVDNVDALRTRFRGTNGEWNCFARVYEEEQQALFYSVCSVNVPEEQRQIMAELLTRANYGLAIGNFEMDFEDGEIRFKTSVDVQDDEFSPALIKNMVYANVMIMDRYMPSIMAVLYGNISPNEAIAQVEAA